jgi:Fic family protein
LVTIVRKTVKGRPYFYLEHTVRRGGKRTTRSRYLGREVPRDIDEVRRRFLLELNREKWFSAFEKIREGYDAEVRAEPKSAREKALLEFSVRFTYNTQRIEGSTLTLRETAQLLEERISPGGRPVGDVKEAEAHQRVFLEMLEHEGDLSQELITDWHWFIFNETKPDIAGKIRRHGVRIAGSRFTPPTPVELQPALDDFFDWYRRMGKAKTNPVELAGLVHLKFVTIHPFGDGNGRVSRLMMNFVLHKNQYPMVDIEYGRRAAYYGSLERSQFKEDERPFMNWFFRNYAREFKGYLTR